LATACLVAHLISRAVIHGVWQGDAIAVLRESLAVFAVPVALWWMRGFGLYKPRRDREIRQEFTEICKAVVTTCVSIITLLWIIGEHPTGAWTGMERVEVLGLHLDGARFEVAVLFVVMSVMLSVERATFRMVLRSLRTRGWNLRHVAIIGTGRLGRVVCRTLERNTWTGLQVRYFVSHHDQRRAEQCLGRPVKGGLQELDRILEGEKPDAVYIALPNSRASQIQMIVEKLERFAVDVKIVPDVQPQHSPQRMLVHELEGMPILSVRESPSAHGPGGAIKRVTDICGAFAALIVFAPVMILAAIAISLSGPGPVMFKQRRVSLGGAQFDIYKFRTMHHVEDEAGSARWTERNDPRVTAIGRLLRSTSIDELPQLFNVLGGSMSLVGPRPERPELILRFREDWRGYMLRQHVKAGMTGWAQVNGLRGDTSLRKRLQLDLFYIRNWSLGFDLKILVLTLIRGFVHRNAH
jgi:Undecaprenyl-phosphate glucose phosphotransferase